jgi:ABC-type branched-subunit amino acid transport system substrate-binding protein
LDEVLMRLLRRSEVDLPSRKTTYTLIIGIAIGMLAAGLGIPFVFGESLNPGNQAASTLETFGPPTSIGTDGAEDSGLTPAGESSVGAPAGDVEFGPQTGDAPPTGGGASPSGASAGAPAPGGATPASTVPASARRASDRGVTPTTIKVAFLLVDLGSISRLGFGVPGFDVETQKKYNTTFIEHLNATGGIHGRKVSPVFVTYDPTQPQTGQAACLQATQDHAVFAAIDYGGGLGDQAALCFTEQNKTPLIGLGVFGAPQSLYRQSQGRFFTINASGVRTGANTAYLLASQGFFKDKRIGIIDRDFPGVVQTVNDGFIAALKREGHDIVHRVDLSMDDGTATSQIPIAVHEMQTRGVDAVMLFADFIVSTQFVQQAEKRAYFPQYFGSDLSAMATDTAVSFMPSSFQAVATTTWRTGEWRVGTPEPARDKACREIYAKATRENPARSENGYGGVVMACGVVDLLRRGTTAPGPDLTRAKYATSLQAIGRIDFPNFAGFSYRPGKTDGADNIRMMRYQSQCRCWMPVGNFVAPKY